MCDPCSGLVTNSTRQPPTNPENRARHASVSASVGDRGHLGLGLDSILDTRGTVQLSVKLEKLAHRILAAAFFQVTGVL